MKQIQGVKFYTVQELAEVLEVTPKTVRKYISKGELKSIRIGRSIYVSEIFLREYLGISKAI